MSVIIRLQNLPWSANALDIRQFFRGLSIPEGGVHIVGGEMGDAFIAFSTDEDARQAMMHDREAINGVQIRLLLSSRAEMQKVIEIARQQSLLALKKASGVVLSQPKSSPPIAVATNIQNAAVSAVPQPPVITASSFQNILTNTTAAAAATPSFLAYQQQAGFTLIPETKNTTATSSAMISLASDDSELRHDRERRRSDSRDRRRSRSHSRERSIFRRRERSRDRSRERDWTNNRRSSRHRSRSRERSHARSRERSRDRSRERERSRNNSNNNNTRDHSRRNSRDSGNINRPRSMDASDIKPKSNLSPWSTTTTNAYQATSYSSTDAGQQQSFMKVANYQAAFNSSTSSGNGNRSMDNIPGASVANMQNYNTANPTLTALNNYSLSGILSAGNSNDSFKGFALQNPYTTALNSATNTASSSSIPGIFVEKKSLETNVPPTAAGLVDNAASLTQEPIAFANVNPYEQMYPNLFAQAAALSSGQKSVTAKPNTMSADSPKAEETKPKDVDPNETNCIKISNMCSRTTYSDLRKFFVGLFIPHNGIKMLNDKHGLRVGIAYVQFSRQSSVAKALCRSKNLLKGKSLIIEAVAEQEFNEAEDSFRPPNQDKEYGQHRSNEADETNDESGNNNNNNNNSGFSALNPYKKMIQLEPFTVLYIEDIPSLATEQDIMKMFSSYSLYDILLIASPENRREFVAYVRFSREEDAKSAYEDRAHHQIGYRRVRMRPSSIEDMENAKEKIRLANEQLMKEEQAAEEEEAKRKLEKLITEHIEKEEIKQKQNIVSMDLTQEDVDEQDDDDDVIETTHELPNNNSMKNRGDNCDPDAENSNSNNSNLRQNDIYSLQSPNNKFSSNLDPRRPQNSNIPSIFDLNVPMNATNLLQNQNRTNLFNDPRLRNMSERSNSDANLTENNNNNNHPAMMGGGGNNFNNFNPNFNNQQMNNNVPNTAMNNMHNNFVILKNCEYNTRINDVAQLLLTANLALKHIEPLRNERQLPTGEFIVEFRRTNDAEIAVQRFHNIQFRNRSLRVFPITPQEIADRLGKPFLSYIPGGNGIRITKGMINDSLTRNLNPANNNANNRFRGNNNPFNDNNGPSNNDDNNGNELNNNNNNGNGRCNNGGNGIPEQFTRPGCVLSLENVPYKAQLSDILNFFQGFDLTPDDIIRRFNDDGSPTGDARVAFMSPEQARAAFESRKRKKLFGRNIFIKTI